MGVVGAVVMWWLIACAAVCVAVAAGCFGSDLAADLTFDEWMDSDEACQWCGHARGWHTPDWWIRDVQYVECNHLVGTPDACVCPGFEP